MRTTLIFGLFSLSVACGGDPCDEYTELKCDCLEEQECDDFKNQYENADADLQDECSARLDEAEEESQECQEDDEG